MLRDFNPAYDRCGSHSVIRRCRLNVRFCHPKAEIDRDQQDQEEGEQRDHSAPTLGDSLLYLINTQQVFGTHKSSNEKRATSRNSAINPSA